MRGIKFLSGFIAFTVILLVAAYLAVSLKGKFFVEHSLSSTFKRPVTVQEVRILLPLGLRLHELNIPGIIQAEDVRVQFSIPFWYNRYLIVDRVDLSHPQVMIRRDQASQWHWGEGLNKQAAPEQAAVSVSSDQKIFSSVASYLKLEGLLIDFLQVTQGQVEFTDVNQKNLHVVLREVELKAHRMTYPLLAQDVAVDFSADISNEDSPFFNSKVKVDGNINLPARNLQGTLLILDNKGNLGLSAILQSINNDMAVTGKINLGRIATHINQHAVSESSLEGFVYSAVQASGLDMGLDYSFQTKMDDFRLDKVSMGGNVIFAEGKDSEQVKIKKDLENLSKQFESFGKQLSGENNPKLETKP